MQPETTPIDAGDGRPGTAPPVVAVLVTRGGAPTLPDALRGLARQEYGNLTVVVVDAGGGQPVAPVVADVMPDAFVRPAGEVSSAPAAANIGAAAVEGATFLLLCHDDAALAPGAVQSMVTEAFRANAGIVGAKLVDWDEPDLLVDVGQRIDKFGELVPVAEPGELDQSQHDGTREVFAVSAAAMLVRADLFADLGGFARDLEGAGADLDLCWRARIAGAQVVVHPAAVARHAGTSPLAEDPTLRRQALREQARTLLTCYSLPHLLRVLPQAVLLSIVDLLASLVTGHGRRAVDVVSAWSWNIAHLPSALGMRARIRRSRRTPDHDLRRLQVRGSARLARAARALRGEGSRRVPEALAAARDLPASWQSDSTMAGLVLVVLLGAMYLIGSRQLISDGIPAIRDFLPFGHPGDLGVEWWSGWRETGISHPGAVPLGFPLLALGHYVLLGGDGLLRTLVLLGAMPVGVLGAWRVLRGVGDVRARVVCALAYAFVPVAYDAVGEGRWTVLLAYAAMPWIVRRLAVASGTEPFAPDRSPVVEGLRMAVPLVLAATFAPAVWLLALGTTVAVSLVLVAFRRTEPAGRVVVAGATGLGATALVLFPTTWDLLTRSDRWIVIWGSTPAGRPRLADLLRLTTGTTTGGGLWYAVPLAAVLVLVVGRTWRFRWGTIGWTLALASWAVVLVVHRWWPGDPHPATGLLLAPAATGLAVAVALGVESFSADVLGGAFGWRQAIASLAGLVAAVSVMPFLAAAVEGRWGLPDGDAVAATSTLAEPGAPASRTLWLGEPDVVPVRTARLRSGAGFAVTEGVAPTISSIDPAAPGAADVRLRRLLESSVAGGSSRLGAGLAPFGVRYVVVVTNLTAGAGGSTPRSVGEIRSTLAQQMDLRSVDVAPGLDVYRNTAFRASAALTEQITGTHAPSSGHVVVLILQVLAVAVVLQGTRRRTGRRATGAGEAGGATDGVDPPGEDGAGVEDPVGPQVASGVR